MGIQERRRTGNNNHLVRSPIPYASLSISIVFDHSANDDLADTTKQFLELKVKELAKKQKEHIDNVKLVTDQIRAIKLSPPPSSDEHQFNPIMDQAITEAKLMTEKHGIESSQAKLAWETLEDIAGADVSETMKAAIDADEECLIEMTQACEALDELNRTLLTTETDEVSR